MEQRWRVVGALAFVVAGALGVAACGDDGGGDAAEAPRPTGAAANDEVLLQGRDLYVKNCARCHGAAGNGGVGPKLAGRVEAAYPNIEDQLKIIRDGKGSMPAWKGQLSDAEIEAVARYEREVL